ncbi:hypothetical protein [Streptomyces sp. B6B3]|uniref:hypothetical protein n=1 Tax=Streptomyces sp. B6B3 TaxID=3153570 RepID=UPI00325C8370
MRIRHVVGAAAAAAVLVIAGPAATASAESTGLFRYSLPGGNEETVDDPIPYQCYEIGAADKQVTRGFNNTVFIAELYADGNCTHSLGIDVLPNEGFVSDPVQSVAFRPA